MRGLVLDGVGDVRHRDDLPDPTIEAPTDAIVRVTASGLCGSDLHPYQGREPFRPGVVPGHEAVGEVVAADGEVTTVAAGQRVLVPFTTSCGRCDRCRAGLTARCRHGQLFGWGDPDDPEAPAVHGAQAEFLRVPLADTTLVAAPNHLDDRAAVLLTDNLPTGWTAARRAGVGPGSTVAVVGLGSVGLCAVHSARTLGADLVVAVDPVASRRAVAAELGADLAVAPEDAEAAVTELTGDDGAASAIEASGTDAGQALGAALLRPGGTLSIIAVQTAARFAVPPVLVYDRNLTIVAGRASVRRVLDELLARVATGTLTVPAAALVTHPDVPLADGPALYARFAAREPGLVKATLRP